MGRDAAQSWIEAQGDYPVLMVDSSGVTMQIGGDEFTIY
jgi:hypothetical protein